MRDLVVERRERLDEPVVIHDSEVLFDDGVAGILRDDSVLHVRLVR